MFRDSNAPMGTRRELQNLSETLQEFRDYPGVRHLCHRQGKSERRRQKQGVPEHKRKPAKDD